jgi:branched-chain amino acid aminotransferase
LTGTERWIFMNGEYKRKEEAFISVFDHGFLYGDGVFEGIRAYDGKVFKLKEHIDRLYDSAKSILLTIPYSKEEMSRLVCDTVRRNRLQDAYIRLVVSRGVGDLGLDPKKCSQSSVIIIADQVRLFPNEFYEKGISIITVPTRRNIPDALDPKIKSLNYLNNILVKIEANLAGVSEALMLNSEGYVAEGSGDNIFIVKNNVLYTPPSYIGALEGITRATIMDLARQKGYEVKEQPFTRHDVYVADEVFLTGTAAEVIGVVKVDGRTIGDGVPGKVTKELKEEFAQYARQEGVPVYENKKFGVVG